MKHSLYFIIILLHSKKLFSKLMLLKAMCRVLPSIHIIVKPERQSKALHTYKEYFINFIQQWQQLYIYTWSVSSKMSNNDNDFFRQFLHKLPFNSLLLLLLQC